MKCKEKDCNYQTNDSHLWIMHGQAHQIAALTTRLQEAEAVIKPFADAYENSHVYCKDELIVPFVVIGIFSKDAKLAADFLKGGTN